MKKIALSIILLLATSVAAFAQSDLQVLAIVKYNKSESITVKQLKTRAEVYERQIGRSLTVQEKKDLLNLLIEEKLLLQAAQKEKIAVSDSDVDQTFAQTLSQQLGANVSEKELSDYIKKTQGKTLEELFLQQNGISVAEYKSNLKNQLLMQQYIIKTKQSEIEKISATNDEVKTFYEANSDSFARSDMMKLFMVIVPKGDSPDKAKITLNDYLNKYKEKKLTADQIIELSTADKSGFQAGTFLLPKTEVAAKAYDMSLESVLYLFSQGEGFVSDIEETSVDYRFISVMKKYPKKFLDLVDEMQPESGVTVYNYIAAYLTQQKQLTYLSNAANEISHSLNTEANVEYKKKDEALDKLLEWEN